MIKLFHILEAQQFDKENLKRIFRYADEMEEFTKQIKINSKSFKGSNYFSDAYREIYNVAGKEMISLFYQPSTRTHASFKIAFERLGGKVIFSTENAKEFSSAVKGETLEDTIRIVGSYYPDVIILRHPETGSAKQAAVILDNCQFNTALINAGDGIGEHPTQALLDLYTIKKSFGEIYGISIAMIGDLYNGRTVRSLSYLLAKCYDNIKIYFVSSPIVKMRDDIKNYLKERNVWFEETDNFKSIAREIDVIYQTRVQKEWFGDHINEYERTKNNYIINDSIIKIMKEGSIIMHPLPRNEEIPIYIDTSPKAMYFKQAQNGLFIRMALFREIFS